MNKTLANHDIKKRLLQKNACGSSLIFALLPFPLFIGLEIAAISMLFDKNPQWWYMSVGGIIPIAMCFLFFKLFGISKAYQQRKKIQAGEFHVVTDYCDNIGTETYDSDGPTTKYIWHFTNTDSQIEVIEPKRDYIQHNPSRCEYYLIFIQGDKQPILFYNCMHYKYENT